MKSPWWLVCEKCLDDFIFMSLRFFAQNYYRSNFSSINDNHLNVTCWLHCNVPWWLNTKVLPRCIFSSVIKWRSHKSKSERNKTHHIFVCSSICDICDNLWLQGSLVACLCRICDNCDLFLWSTHYYIILSVQKLVFCFWFLIFRKA